MKESIDKLDKSINEFNKRFTELLIDMRLKNESDFLPAWQIIAIAGCISSVLSGIIVFIVSKIITII